MTALTVTQSYPSATSVIAPTTVYTGDAGGDTTHTVDAALVQVDDYWNGRTITYLTGDNAGYSRLITDFVDLTDTLTHAAFPNTCDAGDTFYLGAWINPEDAYSFNNTYTYSETDTAEQEYDGYIFDIAGNEVIDKVYAVLKWTSRVTTVVQGDTASFVCSIKIYNGSTWQTYQVTAEAFDVSTANDESLVCTSGNTSDSETAIDITAFLDTPTKINSAKTRLLFSIVATAAGITLRWSVDSISLLVCHHPVGGVLATMKRELPLESRKALLSLKKALQSPV